MRKKNRIARPTALAIAAACVSTLFMVGATPTAQSSIGFSAPSFVDMVRAGGEPGIIHSNKFGDLIYTAHEGTTHIDREGVTGTSIVQFLCPDAVKVDCYKNHVWIWTSDDHGKTWQLRDENLAYTGFSDPDLTQDTSGAIYNTGIDLFNDSVFSSLDGGKTWPNGTTNCHSGDRPWLAGGGKAGELFFTTDTVEDGHELFYSSNFGNSCSLNGIKDNGSYGSNGMTFSGFGKLVYDPFDGSVIEPAAFYKRDGSFDGVGISRLPNARHAFNGGSESFQPLEVVTGTTVYSPFGAPEIMTMDSAENLYFAWDTNERDAKGTGGCSATVANEGGGPTPLPNHIMFVAGKHTAPGTWNFLPPVSLAHQGNARVLWPWSVAASSGKVSVVWYQMDKMVDPDCDIYNNQKVPDVKTYIYEAHITNAISASARQITITNASGRFIHQGGICDSGTTCVLTGQDRRLGDYLTNSVDARGCVIIASGDTTVLDPVTHQPRVTSLPIFIAQNSGPGLTGQDCTVKAAVAAASATPKLPFTRASEPSPPLVPAAVLLAGLLLLAAGIGVRNRNKKAR